MLRIIIVFILLIFLIPCHAQDTTKAPGDTLVIYKDSLGIFNDTLSTRDTTGLLSTKKNIAKGDSLVPLFSGPLSDNSYIITNREIQFTNYRSTEDLLQLYPFYYYKNYGSIGYPTEQYMMGTYFVGYLRNGVPQFDASNDLNLIQSEDIDSVEIIPAPRSYLYSKYPSLINFITKDQVWLRPYTRIKYYQGAFGEALFDGIFNSVLYKKLYGYLNVTNRKFDQSYANTNFSSWQVTARLRYLFSNDYNLTASYNYGKLYKGLNGGVNVDSIGLDNSIIFNEFVAPVRYYHQDMDQLLHNYEIKVLAKPVNNLYLDASFYYHFYENDFNNLRDSLDWKERTKAWNKGILLRSYYKGANYFNMTMNFQYENNKLLGFDGIPMSIYPTLVGPIYNFSAVVDFPISNIITPAVFYKYHNGNNRYGNIEISPSEQSALGADIKVAPIKDFSLYAGYSKLKDNSSYNLQVSASYDIANLSLRGEFVNRRDFTEVISVFSGSLRFRFGSFVLESKNIYDKNLGVYNFREGVYFLDSLFRPNLLLKAGIFMNILRTYYHPFQGYEIRYDSSLDFTLAGEIRRAATIYFTWENILNRQYFIVPYYPMQGSNVRFGIAWELLN